MSEHEQPEQPEQSQREDHPAGVEDTSPEIWRERLVARLRAEGVVHDPAVEQALRRVPRHLFLPGLPLDRAYADVAVPTHWQGSVPISAASQPAIVALMLERLRVEPGMRILEIGAGTGYNAALLAELVGPSGHVTTLDLDAEITAEARAHLDAAGYAQVEVVTADGAGGWPPSAPYDRIELTVSAADIHPAWVAQLAAEGMLVLPLQLSLDDVSIALRKDGNLLRSESLVPCGFMGLRGEEASTQRWATLARGRRLGSPHAELLAPAIERVLATRPRHRLHSRPSLSFLHFLGLSSPDAVTLWPAPSRSGAAPALLPARRLRARYGLYAEDAHGPSLALFAATLPLLLVFGGPAAEVALDATERHWQEARTVPVDAWRITAIPRTTGELPPEPPQVLRSQRRYFIYDIAYTREGER